MASDPPSEPPIPPQPAQAQTDVEIAARRLADAVVRLDALADERREDLAGLRTELASLRQQCAEQERTIGRLKAEKAALERVKHSLAERLDGTIARVQAQLEAAEG